jgi:ubiquinone/menaquinone biosynthesis C-methylase UbiE
MNIATEYAPVTDAPASSRRNGYDSQPWWYDVRGFCILKVSYRGSLLQQIAFFEKNLGARHMEVAVGTGTLFRMILNRRKRRGTLPNWITGVDLSEEMLAGARKTFRGDSSIELIREDVTRLPYADGSFDSVNIANALHCFSDVGAALKEVRRVLAPGGTLALNALLYPTGFAPMRRLASAVNRWGIRKGILHSPFTPEDVRNHLAASGFEIIEDFTTGNCLSIRARKPLNLN